MNISSVQPNHTPSGRGREEPTSNPPLISRNTCIRHVTEHSGLTSLKGSQNTNKIKRSSVFRCLARAGTNENDIWYCLPHVMVFRYLARVGAKENNVWYCLPYVMVFRQSKISVPSPRNDQC